MDIETIFTTPLNDVFTNRDTAYSVLGNRMINSHKRYLVAQGFLAVPPRLNLFRQLMDDMIKAAFSQPKPAAPRVGTGAAQNNNVSESDRLAQLFLTTASPTVRFHALLEAQAKTRITRAGRLTVMDDVAAKSSAKWDLLQEWCENKFWTGPLYHRIHPPHVGNTMCGGRWSHEPGWYCCWVQRPGPKSADPALALFLDRDPDYPYIYKHHAPERTLLNRSFFTRWWKG